MRKKFNLKIFIIIMFTILVFLYLIIFNMKKNTKVEIQAEVSKVGTNYVIVVDGERTGWGNTIGDVGTLGFHLTVLENHDVVVYVLLNDFLDFVLLQNETLGLLPLVVDTINGRQLILVQRNH